MFKKSWDELKVENPVSNKWSKTKVEFFNRDEVKKSLEKIKPDEKAINACFRILSYENLKDYATTYKTENESSQKLAAMIANTIAWHNSEETITVLGKEKKVAPSIWSQMLMDLANNQTPLYEFYTGGTINEIVTNAEDDFFKAAEIPVEHPILKAVVDVRKKVCDKKIEDFYQLYCIQKYWELEKKYNKPDKSDTVKYNYEKYFKDKYKEIEQRFLH